MYVKQPKGVCPKVEPLLILRTGGACSIRSRVVSIRKAWEAHEVKCGERRIAPERKRLVIKSALISNYRHKYRTRNPNCSSRLIPFTPKSGLFCLLEKGRKMPRIQGLKTPPTQSIPFNHMWRLIVEFNFGTSYKSPTAAERESLAHNARQCHEITANRLGADT